MWTHRRSLPHVHITKVVSVTNLLRVCYLFFCTTGRLRMYINKKSLAWCVETLLRRRQTGLVSGLKCSIRVHLSLMGIVVTYANSAFQQAGIGGHFTINQFSYPVQQSATLARSPSNSEKWNPWMTQLTTEIYNNKAPIELWNLWRLVITIENWNPSIKRHFRVGKYFNDGAQLPKNKIVMTYKLWVD